MHRLITLRVSHYNEKARWALDRFSIPYVEESYMPIFSGLRVAWELRKGGNARADKVSSKYSTPVLVTDDGQRICDSTDITRWASDRYASAETSLYPSPEVAALEERFHDHIGPHTRRIVYRHALPLKELFLEVAKENVSARQARAFGLAYPLVARAIRKGLRVSPEGAERSLARLEEELAFVEGRLADGRRYLTGDRFTAADLGFACMFSLALAVQPEEGYAAVMPKLAAAPPELRELIERMRARPAGVFALRMFREERGRRAVPFGGR